VKSPLITGKADDQTDSTLRKKTCYKILNKKIKSATIKTHNAAIIKATDNRKKTPTNHLTRRETKVSTVPSNNRSFMMSSNSIQKFHKNKAPNTCKRESASKIKQRNSTKTKLLNFTQI
jgi:hypothetical protein